MKVKTLLFIAVPFAMLYMFACTSDNLEDISFSSNALAIDTSTLTGISLSTDLVPIFQKYKCYDCHSASVKNGGIDVQTYSNLKSISGSINGKLYGSIGHVSGFKAMPDGGGKMTLQELAYFKSWIENGALNN